MENILKKDNQVQSRKLFYIVFFFFNFIAVAWFLDTWLTPNATSRALPVLSLYNEHTLNFDKDSNYTQDRSKVNGHIYSDKAPLSTFIVFPVYYVYKSMGLKDLDEQTLKKYPIYCWDAYKMPDGKVPTPDGRTFLYPKTSTVFIIGDILCGCLPFLIVLILAFMAIKDSRSKVSPVLLATLPFYASFLFVYAGTFTGHLLAGFFLFMGYFFMKEKKWFLFSGIAAGLAFATEYPIGILFPVWAILIYLNEKRIKSVLYFLVGLVPGVVTILWYNNHITGSAVTTAYSYVSAQQFQGSTNLGFSYPKLSAIWGLLFSLYRGLLVYAPVLILMAYYVLWNSRKQFAIHNFFRRDAHGQFSIYSLCKNYFLVSFVFYVLLISANAVWWGGWTFGPRHLIPVTLIAIYEGIKYLSKKSFSSYLFFAFAAVGVLLAWIDKSTKIYMLPDYDSTIPDADKYEVLREYMNPIFKIIIPDFEKHKFNANTVGSYFFNLTPGESVYLWLILFLLGIIGLTIWYNKLNPAPKPEPLKIQKKPAPVKTNATKKPTKNTR